MFSELDMYCTDPAQHLITAAQHLDALVQAGDVDRDLSDFWTLSSLVRALEVWFKHFTNPSRSGGVVCRGITAVDRLAIPFYHR